MDVTLSPVDFLFDEQAQVLPLSPEHTGWESSSEGDDRMLTDLAAPVGKHNFLSTNGEDAVVGVRPVTLKEVKVEQEKRERNRVSAQASRVKRKQFVQGLEENFNTLTAEHTKLSARVSVLDQENAALRQEVAYLKRVLASSSALSDLLADIKPRVQAQQAAAKGTKRKAEIEPCTVCLTVRGDGELSLETCAHCSEMATESLAKRPRRA